MFMFRSDASPDSKRPVVRVLGEDESLAGAALVRVMAFRQ
jgi:hypothetical protein